MSYFSKADYLYSKLYNYFEVNNIALYPVTNYIDQKYELKKWSCGIKLNKLFFFISIMSHNLVVIKFGGSSQTKFGYDVIAKRVAELRQNNKKIVIVLSAIKGITNLLVELANTKSTTMLEKIINVHYQLITDCKLNNDIIQPLIDKLQFELNQDTHQSKINIISHGEILSTHILYHYFTNLDIKCQWINSKQIINSSAENQNQSCEYNFNKTQFDQIVSEPIIICQGFIASTPSGQSCLLGRGGSDTSGSIIAAGLNADQLEIWTDVNGMYSADPNKVQQAQIINQIDYHVAQELAAMGAKVLHPYCILPCQASLIPIYIRNTYDYNSSEMTIISKQQQDQSTIYAVTDQSDITIFTIKSLDMWNQYGFVYDIFKVFSEFNVDVNIITTSQFTISTTTDENDRQKLQQLKIQLETKYHVTMIQNCAVISIVGQSIQQQPSIDSVLEIIRTQYKLEIMHYSANNLTLSLVVQQKNAIGLLNTLHNKLIKIKSNDQLSTKWWYHNSQILDKLSDIDCAYIYSSGEIRRQCLNLKDKLPVIDQIYYAMKANSNIDILQTINNVGTFGFECVSIQEIQHLNYLKIKAPIIFTPNFCNISEYQYAMAYQNVTIILDNLEILKTTNIFDGQSIGLRINLNCNQAIESGHHQNVITEGIKAKFGCTPKNITEYLKLLKQKNIQIIGLHSHRGSGIHDYKSWLQTATELLSLAKQFPNLKWLNLGGGFGVNQSIDFESLNSQLAKIKPHNIQLWIEPGRYLVANAGVLLAKATQLKCKDNIRFLGVSTGMNSLIRPCLYNAYHPIYNLSKIDDISDTAYNVVGPICESGDFLGFARLLPESKIGDVILIDQTGAYGYVMASSYNLRQPAPEFIVN